MTPINPFTKQILMTAGPTPVPPQVLAKMAEPVLYHRAPAGVELYARVLERLPRVFRTDNTVLAFAASGSGAMDSAVANLVRPGTKALACAAGKFGERWIELCEAYGADLVKYEPGWGVRLDPQEIGHLLDANPGIEVVFATLSETSTGIVHDVAAIAAIVREKGALLVVDAVSGLAAAKLEQNAWGVDVVVAGSQKALMIPPGLAFASVSQRALDAAAAKPGGRYYFDWVETAKQQRKDPPNSPFTPPVTLLAALDVSLGMIEDEGIENVWERHALLARATRAGAAALGLDLYGDPDERSNVVTAIALPDSIEGKQVPKILRDSYGITANGGQAQLAGKIIRIAHCGYFGGFDILTSLSGLEMTLAQLGHPVEQGVGVGAAQKVFLEAGVALGAAGGARFSAA